MASFLKHSECLPKLWRLVQSKELRQTRDLGIFLEINSTSDVVYVVPVISRLNHLNIFLGRGAKSSLPSLDWHVAHLPSTVRGEPGGDWDRSRDLPPHSALGSAFMVGVRL